MSDIEKLIKSIEGIAATVYWIIGVMAGVCTGSVAGIQAGMFTGIIVGIISIPGWPIVVGVSIGVYLAS